MGRSNVLSTMRGAARSARPIPKMKREKLTYQKSTSVSKNAVTKQDSEKNITHNANKGRGPYFFVTPPMKGEIKIGAKPIEVTARPAQGDVYPIFV